jgi:MFS family permease
MDQHRESLQPPADFRRLLVSAASANLADGVRTATLPLMAVTLTDEPLLVSGIAAVADLPAVLGGTGRGSHLDRHDRRGLLVVGQSIRAIATISFVGLLLPDAAGIWALYVLALLLGGAEVVVDGASQAVIPKLVPVRLLERANARMESAQLVFEQMVGTAIGGVLFAFGAVFCFAVNSVALVISGVSATSIRRPLPPRAAGEAPGTWRHDIGEGFAFLGRHPLLGWLSTFGATANLASTVGGSVLVLLVVDELGATGAAFGLVLAAGAVAGLATSLATEHLVRRIGRGRTMLAGAGLQVVALFVIATGAECRRRRGRDGGWRPPPSCSPTSRHERCGSTSCPMRSRAASRPASGWWDSRGSRWAP